MTSKMMMSDLESAWQRLMDMQRRQMVTFGYHTDDTGMPAWDFKDSEDVYTHHTYQMEQTP